MNPIPSGVVDRSVSRDGWALFLACALTYALFNYGGIRSPDGEVMFRTAQALAERRTFAVEQPLAWESFGLPRGTDGRRYAIFGPGLPLAAAPLVALAERCVPPAAEGANARYPVSYYTGGGYADKSRAPAPPDARAHAVRFYVSFFNAFVAAGCVALFYFLTRRLGAAREGALFAALLLAFGSLLFPYAGTFFSEPLALLGILGSLYTLSTGTPAGCAMAGFFLGLSIATHISSALFAPFWLAYAVAEGDSARHRVIRGACFASGLALPLLLLGAHHYARFGNIFETGRTADPQMRYAAFVAPWRGLWGLLAGAGKGLLWSSPALLLALAAWPALHRARPKLAWTLSAALLARLFFVASRSDWHGGFCLGPRLLLPAAALALLAVAFEYANWTPRARRVAWAALLLCVLQQIYFCTGEIFSFYLRLKWAGERAGRDLFVGDALYLERACAPIEHLWRGEMGPWIWQGSGLSFWSAWSLAAGCAAALGLLAAWRWRRSQT
ncbi:MAG: hypothetical protein HS116_16060 [Planctomycetes bacterium]|nr:hypothetical protein [Planctomycetota bacterium]